MSSGNKNPYLRPFKLISGKEINLDLSNNLSIFLSLCLSLSDSPPAPPFPLIHLHPPPPPQKKKPILIAFSPLQPQLAPSLSLSFTVSQSLTFKTYKRYCTRTLWKLCTHLPLPITVVKRSHIINDWYCDVSFESGFATLVTHFHLKKLSFYIINANDLRNWHKTWEKI